MPKVFPGWLVFTPYLQNAKFLAPFWWLPYTKIGLQIYGQKYGAFTYLHFRILKFPLIMFMMENPSYERMRTEITPIKMEMPI